LKSIYDYRKGSSLYFFKRLASSYFMIPKQVKESLRKQHYMLIGEHSCLQVCRWTKKSLTNKGVCYKEKFYGINSHLCCQISPWLGCQNKCIHCWRPIENDFKIFLEGLKDEEVMSPEKIIEECIKAQKKMIIGFKGNKDIDVKKYKEAQEPMQFALSLIGEPILYPKIGEIIQKLRGMGKTSFLVTNGLSPEILKRLQKNNQLPTQLYVSLNSPNKEHYEKWHNSCEKEAWEKLNETLSLLPKLKTRKVIRMTLVKEQNMKEEHLKEYAELIRKASPDFIEVKGFMSVGYSRNRLGFETMPMHSDIKEYANKLQKELENEEYKILDEHVSSRVVLIGKDRERMKIQKTEI
jgi:tRNA wybutosine-synthesizing protein 1